MGDGGRVGGAGGEGPPGDVIVGEGSGCGVGPGDLVGDTGEGDGSDCGDGEYEGGWVGDAGGEGESIHGEPIDGEVGKGRGCFDGLAGNAGCRRTKDGLLLIFLSQVFINTHVPEWLLGLTRLINCCGMQAHQEEQRMQRVCTTGVSCMLYSTRPLYQGGEENR